MAVTKPRNAAGGKSRKAGRRFSKGCRLFLPMEALQGLLTLAPLLRFVAMNPPFAGRFALHPLFLTLR
jgi:hypothetical protein